MCVLLRIHQSEHANSLELCFTQTPVCYHYLPTEQMFKGPPSIECCHSDDGAGQAMLSYSVSATDIESEAMAKSRKHETERERESEREHARERAAACVLLQFNLS